MAIITISRQVAALGDEIASAAAERLGYTFEDRKNIEKHIVKMGFPEEKLKKYDERKPGFFASLAKDRDEYHAYLQTAILEAAEKNNVILIGRGASIILEDIPHHIALRFVSADEVRRERLKKEFNWDDKKANQRIEESDANRLGFHKSFFNVDNADPVYYHVTLNTGILNIPQAVAQIEALLKTLITPDVEELGKFKLGEQIKAQHLVNQLVFNYHMNINFLRAEISDNVLTLHGVSDSSAQAEKAVAVAGKLLVGYKIQSAITVVQDYKAYP